MSIGSILNKVCDLFLPDAVGDVLGCVADAFTGNIAGAVANGCDAIEDVFDAFGCDEGSAVFGVLSDAAGLAGGTGAGLAGGLDSGVVGTFDQASSPTGIGSLFGDIASLAGANEGAIGEMSESRELFG